MKKLVVKLVSAVLLLAILCSILPGAVFAAETEAQSGQTAVLRTDRATKAGETDTYSYRLVTSAKYLTAGEYLIIASATGAYAGEYSHYALTTKEDGSYRILQGIGQKFTTLPMSVNVPASLHEQFAWTAQGDANGLSLKNSAGAYMTAVAGSTALDLSTTSSVWTASYNSDAKSFVFSSNGRYLALRDDQKVVGDNGMCGFSTLSSANMDVNMYVYKRVNTTDLKEITLYHSLNLASDMTLNFVIAKSQLEGFEDLRIEVTLPEYEGNTLVDLNTVTLEPVLSGNMYYFVLEGMTAVQMNDILQAVVYAHKEGLDYVSEVDYYSIGTYAYNQLAKDSSSYTLRAVCAELLRYGGRSQQYKGYRTDALVDANMTEAQMAYLTVLEDVKFGSNNTVLNDLAEPSVTWAGKSLDLQSKVTLRMILNLTKYTGKVEDLSVRVTYVTLEGKTVTVVVEDCEVYDSEKGFYAFNFTGLRAAELRTVVSAAAYVGETQVSPTLKYSVDTYGNGKTGALLAACRALIAYSDAALNYFAK